MKILLLGKNGQVGWELQRALAPLGYVVALGRAGENGLCGDLADLDGVCNTVREVRPDVLVNAAAYTEVDKAESEPELAHLINARAPARLAGEMQKLGGWIVHYSTDYVFSGRGSQPWREDDSPDPLNEYGRGKLAGEQAIRSSGCYYLIFRTSWVYGARGNNFAKTMIRLARDREQLKVIEDQVGAPTGAELLADATAHAVRKAGRDSELAGLYHLVASGETSWFEYARFVIEQTRQAGEKLAVQSIEPIPTTAYPTPAERPANSRLNTGKFTENFGLTLPEWRQGVSRMLTECQDNVL